MEKLFDRSHILPNTLANLIHQSETHQHLLQKLQALLPSAVQNALVDCVIQGNKLTLFAQNTAVLNRLRLHQYELLSIANQEHSTVSELIYSLAPAQRDSTPRQPPSRPIADDTTTTALTALAEQVSDTDLSNSLRALANALTTHKTQALGKHKTH